MNESAITKLAQQRWAAIMPHGHVGQQSLISVDQITGRKWNNVKSCLELGCGSGALAVFMCTSFPELSICGFDCDKSAIEEATELARGRMVSERATFLVHDFDSPGVVFSSTYDAVLSTDAIQYAHDPQGLLARMTACWRATGPFYVSAWTFESTDVARNVAKSWLIHRPMPRSFYIDNAALMQCGLIVDDCSTVFVNRLEASLLSLESAENDYCELFGQESFKARLTLEKRTVELAHARQLGQVLIHGER